jgi:membrane protease YdiL (CAAX protease family)
VAIYRYFRSIAVVSVRRYQPIAEALVMLVATFPLAVGLHVPTLWLLAPLVLLTFTKRSYRTYGLTWEQPGSAVFHVIVALVIFVPYMVGHYALAHWWLGVRFHFRWPPAFVESAIDQVLAIALPEEFFFRGYFQTDCDRVFGLWARAAACGCRIRRVSCAVRRAGTAHRILSRTVVWLVAGADLDHRRTGCVSCRQ